MKSSHRAAFFVGLETGRCLTSDFLYDLLSYYSTYARPTPSRCARLPLPEEGANGAAFSRIVISSEVEKSSLQSDKRLRD